MSNQVSQQAYIQEMQTQEQNHQEVKEDTISLTSLIQGAKTNLVYIQTKTCTNAFPKCVIDRLSPKQKPLLGDLWRELEHPPLPPRGGPRSTVAPSLGSDLKMIGPTSWYPVSASHTAQSRLLSNQGNYTSCCNNVGRINKNLVGKK